MVGVKPLTQMLKQVLGTDALAASLYDVPGTVLICQEVASRIEGKYMAMLVAKCLCGGTHRMHT